jgi:hypothetical protein
MPDASGCSRGVAISLRISRKGAFPSWYFDAGDVSVSECQRQAEIA